MNGSNIFISQIRHCRLVIPLCDVVGLDDSCKDREAVGTVQGTVIIIQIDACQFLGKGGM